MEYDEDRVATWYLWRHCQHLMTDAERRANRAGMIEIKADAAEARGSVNLARTLREQLDTPEIMAELSGGFEAFRRRVTLRLLADPEIQATLNRCPACGRIVQTPRAQQCLWCKHVWRGQGG